MMRLLMIGFMALLLATDGTSRWREADRAYREGDYERAAEGYAAALEQPDLASNAARRFQIESNLGAALHRLGRHAEAREAFARAAEIAPDDRRRARAQYNAGTSALAAGDYAPAVGHLRDALISRPGMDDAQHNLELALTRVPPEEMPDAMMGDSSAAGTGDDEEENAEPESGDDDAAEATEGEDQTPGDESDDAADDDDRGQPEEGEQEEVESDRGRPEPALSREQAERLLQALEQGEQDAVRDVRQAPAPQRRIERDW